MMLISDKVSLAIVARKPAQMDKVVCDKYEAANELFEQLLQAGVIAKRGYQLCPIESKVCVDTQINHSTKE